MRELDDRHDAVELTASLPRSRHTFSDSTSDLESVVIHLRVTHPDYLSEVFLTISQARLRVNRSPGSVHQS